jgi:putative ABC transport system permease protein
VRSSARVALLGHKAADHLFDGEDPIGKQIQIGGAPFRVKGILEHHGFDPHGFDRDDEVHVPISTMMRRVVNVDTIGAAKLLIERPDQVDETADEIADILYARPRCSRP